MSKPAPPITITDFCARLGVPAPEGMGDTLLTGITTLGEARAGDVSFLARAKFAADAESSQAALIIVPPGTKLERKNKVEMRDVWSGVLTGIEYFHAEPLASGKVHPTAIVPESCNVAPDVDLGAYVVLGENVTIAAGTRIGPHVVIGDDAVIGGRVLLHPNVTIAHGCKIGNRVIIHSGTVIGSDGFKYEPTRNAFTKIPQVGIVVIEDDVEIGANTAIDRASFTETRVGARTKMDNLIHMAHNVTVGSDSIILGQVGIAGSTKVGRGVIIAGQAGLVDNITVGDGCKIGGRSAVIGNLAPGTVGIGEPLLPAVQHHRMQAVMKRLPDIYRKLKPYLGDDEEKT
jgi:UDP-3-O-[3-hydroxymyristoyl] glucosamine N-acyltransferase